MKKWMFFCAKVFVTFLFFFYFARKYNLNSILDQLNSSDQVWIFFAFILLLLQILLMAARWHLISKMINVSLSIFSAIRFMLIGQFFNQIMPSSIGGDAIRIWMSKQNGNTLVKASISTILDRLMGLLMYIFLPAFSLLIFTRNLNDDFSTIESFVKLTAFSATFGMLTLYFFGVKLGQMTRKIPRLKFLETFIKDMRIISFDAESWRVLVLSFLIQLIQILMILLIAKSFKIIIPLNVGMILIPIIFLISTIPLSFAGWGLRESAMIIGFGFFNIPAINSLSISVTYGLLQIVSSLPGVLLWMQCNIKNQSDE